MLVCKLKQNFILYFVCCKHNSDVLDKPFTDPKKHVEPWSNFSYEFSLLQWQLEEILKETICTQQVSFERLGTFKLHKVQRQKRLVVNSVTSTHAITVQSKRFHPYVHHLESMINQTFPLPGDKALNPMLLDFYGGDLFVAQVQHIELLCNWHDTIKQMIYERVITYEAVPTECFTTMEKLLTQDNAGINPTDDLEQDPHENKNEALDLALDDHESDGEKNEGPLEEDSNPDLLKKFLKLKISFSYNFKVFLFRNFIIMGIKFSPKKGCWLMMKTYFHWWRYYVAKTPMISARTQQGLDKLGVLNNLYSTYMCPSVSEQVLVGITMFPRVSQQLLDCLNLWIDVTHQVLPESTGIICTLFNWWNLYIIILPNTAEMCPTSASTGYNYIKQKVDSISFIIKKIVSTFFYVIPPTLPKCTLVLFKPFFYVIPPKLYLNVPCISQQLLEIYLNVVSQQVMGGKKIVHLNVLIMCLRPVELFIFLAILPLRINSCKSFILWVGNPLNKCVSIS
ncbi:hypothetical protein VP01_597g1 [Puccinia sorghi]|uniref:Uncharacterized protein n=1 Tax=Puccinia sorghi TaxID=27349 RepID=A0A0L6UIB8_9BASI|nr:hypothetical protein VP01_597g1 [Puccinia sorghi]